MIEAGKWRFAILEAQIETGVPDKLYEDSYNKKEKEQDLGTIKSVNVCTEVVEYTPYDLFAVCSLAPAALNKSARFS